MQVSAKKSAEKILIFCYTYNIERKSIFKFILKQKKAATKKITAFLFYKSA